MDRAHRGVVFGVADRHAGVGGGDLRLGQLLDDVGALLAARANGRRGQGVAFPVAEEAFHLVAQRPPTRNCRPRPGWRRAAKQTLMALADVLDGEGGDALDRAAVVVAERRGVVALAQLDQDFRPRLVFQAADVLQGQRTDGVQLVFRQVRPQQNVGVDFEGGGQVAGDGGAPETHVDAADALAAVQAEVVDGQRQLAAVAFAGPARDEVAEDGAGAETVGPIVDVTGRDQEVEGRRTHVRHGFGQQRQAVGEGVLINVLRHDHLT